jgi:hypothetical protein
MEGVDSWMLSCRGPRLNGRKCSGDSKPSNQELWPQSKPPMRNERSEGPRDAKTGNRANHNRLGRNHSRQFGDVVGTRGRESSCQLPICHPRYGDDFKLLRSTI